MSNQVEDLATLATRVLECDRCKDSWSTLGKAGVQLAEAVQAALSASGSPQRYRLSTSGDLPVAVTDPDGEYVEWAEIGADRLRLQQEVYDLREILKAQD